MEVNFLELVGTIRELALQRQFQCLDKYKK